MNFLFGPPATIDVQFTGEDLKQATMNIPRGSGNKAVQKTLYLFNGDDTISGKVVLKPSKNKKVEHNGVKIELIGQVELTFDRGNHYVFTSLIRELDAPGELTQEKIFPFEFANVEKNYESYNGTNVRLRYFVRVKIAQRYSTDIKKEVDFIVQTTQLIPEINNPLKMEVGIEDCLHIEFEYERSKYHLHDVIVGKIYFMLVRIKIKHMELQILKRESTGTGPNVYNETDVVTKFEVMDGAPVRGECIPVRLFLSQLNLSPTMKSIHNKFSVRYYINLVLIDEEDRRYFKQQEINIWRKKLQVDNNKSIIKFPIF
eukprot:196089_1